MEGWSSTSMMPAGTDLSGLCLCPLGHDMAVPPPTSPPLSRLEKGEADGCQWRQPLFESAFPQGLPTPLLALCWPALSAQRLGNGHIVTPSKGGIVGREPADLEGLVPPSQVNQSCPEHRSFIL